MREQSALTVDRGLRHLLRSAQCICRRDLQLTPCQLPAELAKLEGTLDGKPLTLHSWRYRGSQSSTFTLAVLEVAQRLCSFTAIGLPTQGAPWPILGIDIIALRGTISLVALDLAPTDEAFWTAHCTALLAAIRAQVEDAVIPRKHPGFTHGVFSPLALIAGARMGGEAAVFTAADSLLSGTASILRSQQETSRSAAAQLRRDRWLDAEKRNRKEHNALEKMFGSAIATRYLDDFLFAVPEGATS
jgi:hypothetical protein